MNQALSLPELMALLDAANAVRGEAVADDNAVAREALRVLNDRFQVEHRLAIYGTLAPGRPNHHLVEPLGGDWLDGFVEGDLLTVGWGAALGYRALVPRVGGPAVPVKLLTTSRLRAFWPELDRFEGPEYERVLVPVFGEASGPVPGTMPVAVAYLYAASLPAR